MKTKFKSVMRRALYDVGAFGLFHRIRNRRTLTTFMFHRVLPADSREYQLAEREFTFSVSGFSACLDFIQKHYTVVNLTDLSRARQGRRLPANAALITFDDGWRDTICHAGPELKKRGLKAVLFAVAEIEKLAATRWWQDALVSVFADSQATQRLLEELGLQALIFSGQDAMAHKVTSVLAMRSERERLSVLEQVLHQENIPRQMLTSSELTSLDADVFEIGGHGYSHAPLTQVSDAKDELIRSYAFVESYNKATLSAMSFPHGAFDLQLVDLAKECGFEWVFTSEPLMTMVPSGLISKCALGRMHIPENEWTCHEGQVSFPHLATFLFFRSISSRR